MIGKRGLDPVLVAGPHTTTVIYIVEFRVSMSLIDDRIFRDDFYKIFD